MWWPPPTDHRNWTMLPCEGDYDGRFSKIIIQTFRFTKRIYVEMPDRAGRGALVNHLLTQHGEHRYDTVSCVNLSMALYALFLYLPASKPNIRKQIICC